MRRVKNRLKEMVRDLAIAIAVVGLLALAIG